MNIKFDPEEIREFIRGTSPETKVYIGADSERFKRHGKWYAAYTIAVVIHYDGCRGCKVFGKAETELDYDQQKDKPRMRLMNEVMKVAEMYMLLEDALEDREVEIHLDINPNKKYGSSCVIQEAIGYIRGMCNITPKVKPEAFAASYTADRLQEIMANAPVAA